MNKPRYQEAIDNKSRKKWQEQRLAEKSACVRFFRFSTAFSVVFHEIILWLWLIDSHWRAQSMAYRIIVVNTIQIACTLYIVHSTYRGYIDHTYIWSEYRLIVCVSAKREQWVRLSFSTYACLYAYVQYKNLNLFIYTHTDAHSQICNIHKNKNACSISNRSSSILWQTNIINPKTKNVNVHIKKCAHTFNRSLSLSLSLSPLFSPINSFISLVKESISKNERVKERERKRKGKKNNEKNWKEYHWIERRIEDTQKRHTYQIKKNNNNKNNNNWTREAPKRQKIYKHLYVCIECAIQRGINK